MAERPAPRLLDDVLEVFENTEARLWSETIIARLVERHASAYDGWTPTDLANALRPYGVSTIQIPATDPADGERKNRRGVVRDDVVQALADRPVPGVTTLPTRPDGDRR